MVILAFSLTDLSFVFVEKGKEGFQVMDKGVLTPENASMYKKAHYIVAETSQARFIHDTQFAIMDDNGVQQTLEDALAGKDDRSILLTRPSPMLAATLRTNVFNEHMNTFETLGLFPHGIAPQAYGLYLGLVKQRTQGRFSICINKQDLVFVVEQGALADFGSDPYRNKAIAAAGPISSISLHELDFSDIEEEYASLLGLALFTDNKTPCFSTAELSDKAAEPLRMRRSILTAVCLSVPLLLAPVICGYMVHGKSRELSALVETNNDIRKKTLQAKELEKEAVGYLSGLSKINQALSPAAFKSALLLEIANRAPLTISITSLSEDGRLQAAVPAFTLIGNAPAMADVYTFEAALKKGFFNQSRVIDTRKIKIQGNEAVSFKIVVKQ